MPNLILTHLQSKKFFLTLLVTVLAFLVFAIPPFFHRVILAGSEFITLISLVFAFYHAANVTQKHAAFNAASPSQPDQAPNPAVQQQ